MTMSMNISHDHKSNLTKSFKGTREPTMQSRDHSHLGRGEQNTTKKHSFRTYVLVIGPGHWFEPRFCLAKNTLRTAKLRVLPF